MIRRHPVLTTIVVVIVLAVVVVLIPILTGLGATGAKHP